MADNKILAFRRKKGITQKQLADLVGTSQQQLHRIEAGKQSVRFDLAEKICSAFHEPMELVFPGTKKPLEKLNKKYRKPSTPNFDDKDFVEAMTRADVDMDPAEWSLEYRLRGGAKGALVISSIEKSRRLFVVVQRGQGYTDLFVVFDSEGTRVVLNLDHLTFCRFLYDAPQLSNIPPPDCDSGENVRVFMTDSSEPLLFEVEVDMWHGDDEMGQFGHLMDCAEMSEGENNEVFHFTNINGETAFFRAKDIAMIQVPLWVVEPDLLDMEEDEATNDTTIGNA